MELWQHKVSWQKDEFLSEQERRANKRARFWKNCGKLTLISIVGSVFFCYYVAQKDATEQASFDAKHEAEHQRMEALITRCESLSRPIIMQDPHYLREYEKPSLYEVPSSSVREAVIKNWTIKDSCQ